MAGLGDRQFSRIANAEALVAMAFLFLSEKSFKTASQAVQFHGGYGYMKDLRVERLMRDAKLTQIWEGANELQRQMIGRGFATAPGKA